MKIYREINRRDDHSQQAALAIVGGGISGLSAAYYAVRRSRENHLPLRVMVFEAEARLGGKVVTERVAHDDGYFIIEGGPDTFLATKPGGVALCKDLNLSERLQGTNPNQRNTYVLHRGKLIPLPDGLALMIPADIPSVLRSQLLTWGEKMRMGVDFLLPPRNGNEDESLGSFISRRLGRAAYENLIEPLMSGIYAGDGDQLSLAATFPYLRDLERKYGSLARGALIMRKAMGSKQKSGWRSSFLTPLTGLGEMIEALEQELSRLDVELHLSSRVFSIEQGESAGRNGFILTVEPNNKFFADGLILAANAFQSGQLLRSLNTELGELLQSIPYTSTATISLAYRAGDLPRPLDGYGYVIPRREKRRALACTWTSTKFPHRAPLGYVLLRVFVGRAGEEADLPHSEDALLELAKEELRLSLRITAEPLLYKVFYWEKAMPQYNLGHLAKLQRIAAILQNEPTLALAGNGYHGIGIPDCIASGEQAANKVLSGIKEKVYED